MVGVTFLCGHGGHAGERSGERTPAGSARLVPPARWPRTPTASASLAASPAAARAPSRTRRATVRRLQPCDTPARSARLAHAGLGSRWPSEGQQSRRASDRDVSDRPSPTQATAICPSRASACLKCSIARSSSRLGEAVPRPNAPRVSAEWLGLLIEGDRLVARDADPLNRAEAEERVHERGSPSVPPRIRPRRRHVSCASSASAMSWWTRADSGASV